MRDNPLVAPDIASSLQATYHRALMTHLQALADLPTIGEVLDALDTPWLVVKGPVLAEIAYPRPDLRGYTDLDIVGSRSRPRRSCDALEQAGARVLDTNWDLLGRTRSSELHLMVGRTLVDLHWHLFNIGDLRDEFPLAMAPLFERARRVALPGVTVPTLDEVDTVMHLGVHGCLSGANRLVWLKDIEQASGAPGFAWDELVARTRASGTGLHGVDAARGARRDRDSGSGRCRVRSRAAPRVAGARRGDGPRRPRRTGDRTPLPAAARRPIHAARSAFERHAPSPRRGLIGARDRCPRGRTSAPRMRTIPAPPHTRRGVGATSSPPSPRWGPQAMSAGTI